MELSSFSRNRVAKSLVIGLGWEVRTRPSPEPRRPAHHGGDRGTSWTSRPVCALLGRPRGDPVPLEPTGTARQPLLRGPVQDDDVPEPLRWFLGDREAARAFCKGFDVTNTGLVRDIYPADFGRCTRTHTLMGRPCFALGPQSRHGVIFHRPSTAHR